MSLSHNTNYLAVHRCWHAGQSSGELERGIVYHMVLLRAHVLSHEFKRAGLGVLITYEIYGEGVPGSCGEKQTIIDQSIDLCLLETLPL